MILNGKGNVRGWLGEEHRACGLKPDDHACPVRSTRKGLAIKNTCMNSLALKLPRQYHLTHGDVNTMIQRMSVIMQ